MSIFPGRSMSRFAGFIVRVLRPLTCGVLCLCGVSGAERVLPRRATLEDLTLLRSLGQVSMSPDGARILYSVTSDLAADPAIGTYLVDVATGESKRVDLGAPGFKMLSWARDGQRVRYLAPKDGKTVLWEWQPDTQTASVIMGFDRSLTAYAVSPDETKIAFTCTVPVTAADRNAKRNEALRASGLVIDLDEDRYTQETEIWILGRASRRQEKIFTGWIHRRFFTAVGIYWSPESSRLAFDVYSGDKRDVHFHGSGSYSYRGRTMVWRVGDGEPRVLTPDLMRDDRFLAWSPDGRFMAVDADLPEESRMIPEVGARLTTGSQPELWELDAGGARLRDNRPLLAAKVPFRRDPWFNAFWHESGRLLVAARNEERTFRIQELPIGGNLTAISDPRWSLDEVSFACAAEKAAAVSENVNEPPELAVVDLKSGTVKRLTNLNDEFRSFARSGVTPFPVTNRFGISTQNFLLRPATTTKPAPLLLLLYNWNNQFHDRSWMRNFCPQEYARRGFAVILVNYPSYDGAIGPDRKTIGERMRFGLAINPLGSIEAVVDRAVAEGIADPAKVGIAGFSYGAFLAQYAVTHSNKFAAAMINDGGSYKPTLYNWFTVVNSKPVVTHYRLMLGGSPISGDIDEWRRFMPTHSASRLRIPVLTETHIVKSAESLSPDLLRTIDFHIEALEGGAPVEFIAYAGEHILADPRQQLSSMHRSADWFQFWLQGVENPDSVDPSQYVRWNRLRERARPAVPSDE